MQVLEFLEQLFYIPSDLVDFGDAQRGPPEVDCARPV